MTTLTIALPLDRPTVGTEFGYALSEDGHSLDGQGAAAVTLLPRADTVVLVVPVRALSWHMVKIPPLAANRRRAALEGMLEDRLLDEPGTLALAAGPQRRPDGSSQVAACDKAWLSDALHFFEQAGRPANRVVPALAPLAPGEPGRMMLVASGTPDDAWLALADESSVVSVPLTQARSLLPVDAGDGEGLVAVAEPAVAEIAEQVLGRPVTARSAAQALLESCQSNWEIAQFDLAISGRGRIARRWAQASKQWLRAPRWRAARWGLAGLLVAHLVGLNAWAWRLEGDLASRRTQVRQLLTQTFPGIKTVVDAPLQMERQVALLRQSSGALSQRDLETMLSALGTALPDAMVPAGVEFSAGQLSVKGVSLSPAQMELVSGKLSAQGYAARLDVDRLSVRAGGRP